MLRNRVHIMLTALTLVALMAVALVVPRPAYAMSDGCTKANLTILDGQYTVGIISLTPVQFNAGEQIIVMAGTPATANPGDSISLSDGGSPVDTGTFPGTLTYTIPADGNYEFEWRVSGQGVVDATWSISCVEAGSNPTTGAGGSVEEPFFETVVPALSVDAGKAADTTHNGVKPLAVFDARWWGVKTVSAANFPALAGVDLSTTEVLCLNDSGEWTGEYVSEWASSEDFLQAYVKQHGICGVFPK